MELSKIKIGASLNYKTSRGTTGRGKVTDIGTTNTGTWVTVHDKTNDKTLRLRPAFLSTKPL